MIRTKIEIAFFKLVLLFLSILFIYPNFLFAQQPNKNSEFKSYHRNRRDLVVQVLQFDNKDIKNMASMESIVKAVRYEAKKRWEMFAIGNPIPMCNDKGKLKAYQVPVAINTTEFPDVLSPLQSEDVILTSLNRSEIWAEKQYWTFVVSASEDEFPVPLYHPGLPPFLVTYHKAASIARSRLAAKNVSIDKYYWLGHSGNFFEFTSDSGEVAFINAYNMKIVDRDKVLLRSERAKDRNLPSTELKVESPNDEMYHIKSKEIINNQIKEEWSKIKNQSK
jgi:hypothetical protein